MSCWVVPTLAAEYWGISIEEVERKILANEVLTQQEAGFLLIDVEPHSPHPEKVTPRHDPTVPSRPLHESQLPRGIDKISQQIQDDGFGDFRLARIQTARLRRPPGHRLLH